MKRFSQALDLKLEDKAISSRIKDYKFYHTYAQVYSTYASLCLKTNFTPTTIRYGIDYNTFHFLFYSLPAKRRSNVYYLDKNGISTGKILYIVTAHAWPKNRGSIELNERIKGLDHLVPFYVTKEKAIEKLKEKIETTKDSLTKLTESLKRAIDEI